MKTDLDREFEKAFLKASSTKLNLPPDIKLKLYAYYKQATSGTNLKSATGNDDGLINAFKLNAWLQVSHLTEEEAKQAYIDLVKITYTIK